MELDPTESDAPRRGALAEGDITRASLGAQAFDPPVQSAIGRLHNFAQTAAAVRGL